METSFDVVCPRSEWRHHTTLDIVLKGLQESPPLSDQAELVRQSLVDEVEGMMEGFLLRETQRSGKALSAEYFAECWDYLLWSRYKIKCGIDEIFPFQYPEYRSEHVGTPAPEHVRIMEPQKPDVQTAEDDAKVQAGLADVTEDLGKMKLSRTQFKKLSKTRYPPLYNFLAEAEVEWTPASSRPAPPSPSLSWPKLLSPPPMRCLPSPTEPMSDSKLRERCAATVLDGDEDVRLWRDANDAIIKAEAEEAGMSEEDYRNKLLPVNDKYTPQTEADRIRATSATKAATEPAKEDLVAKPASQPAKEEPVAETAAEPATKPSSEPAKMSWSERVGDAPSQAAPPAPTVDIPYKAALSKLAKPQPAQPAQLPPASKPSAAPKAKAPASQKPIVRPVREDLVPAFQDRVLTLKVRQEIWDEQFTSCQRQEGAEPLQVQIPRSKKSSLLIGEVIEGSEGKLRTIFDKLRFYLPSGIDVIYQDSPDNRFGLTLLYIGVKNVFKDSPQCYASINALFSAWDIFYHWACLVEKGYEIDVVRFATWKLDGEVDTRYHSILDRDGSMAKALEFVEGKNIPLAQPVAKPRKERATRPKPGQHQAKVLAERRAQNKQIAELREQRKQEEKAYVLARVAIIMEECREEPDNTTLDWITLEDKFFQLAVDTANSAARASWIHEGGLKWRKQNIADKSEEQVLFDRKLHSWWCNFLGALGNE